MLRLYIRIALGQSVPYSKVRLGWAGNAGWTTGIYPQFFLTPFRVPCVPLTDSQTHLPRMRQQQEHQECSDERHILRKVDHVNSLHLRIVHLPEAVHLKRDAQQEDNQ